MKRIVYLLSHVFVWACIGNHPNDDITQETTDEMYEFCCAAGYLEQQVGVGKVVAPSLVTSNYDGWNDVFAFFGDSGIVSVTDFTIYDRDNNIIFKLDSIEWDHKSTWWNPTNLDGSTYQGWFKFSGIATDTNGYSEVVSGISCSLKCEDGIEMIPDTSSCVLGIQFDEYVRIGYRAYDPYCD